MSSLGRRTNLWAMRPVLFLGRKRRYSSSTRLTPFVSVHAALSVAHFMSSAMSTPPSVRARRPSIYISSNTGTGRFTMSVMPGFISPKTPAANMPRCTGRSEISKGRMPRIPSLPLPRKKTLSRKSSASPAPSQRIVQPSSFRSLRIGSLLQGVAEEARAGGEGRARGALARVGIHALAGYAVVHAHALKLRERRVRMP